MLMLIELRLRRRRSRVPGVYLVYGLRRGTGAVAGSQGGP